MHYFIKLALSAATIVAVSEVSNRSSFVGGLLASLPLVSFLGMLWLYADTKDVEKVADLSMNIFLARASSVGFLCRAAGPFEDALESLREFCHGDSVMLACYDVMVVILRTAGVKL